MSLSMHRAIDAFLKSDLPRLTSEVEDLAGFPLLIEIDMASLAPALSSESEISEHLTKVFFTPLLGALKEVLKDDIGKGAFKKGVTKVTLSNTKGNYSDVGFATLTDGHLVLDHEPSSNVSDWKDRQLALVKVLDQGLSVSSLELA